MRRTEKGMQGHEEGSGQKGDGMRELEIYIHIPFCVKKCAYCDFLSAPASEEAQRQYLQALLQEIRSFPRKEEYEVVSVFFGGGTPSIWPSDWTGMVLAALRESFSFGKDPEITIECNPGTADAKKLAAYRSFGINRISFGLQSADNRELRLLGRIHSFETFCETYKSARQAGFSNINVDLMSALPGQTPESWQETLKQVLALRPEHISAYSLIIEEQTPFYEAYHEDDERRAKGERPQYLPSEDEERAMYEDTERMLSRAGLYRYEISNYAKPGFACFHNIGYWTGMEYVGFGLGASSLLAHIRYKNTENMQCYLQAYGAGAAKAAEQVREREALSMQDEMEEFMFLGLRMMQGVQEQEFAGRFGQNMEAVYGSVLERLSKEGLLIRQDGNIRLTKRGVSLSNYVMAEFLL